MLAAGSAALLPSSPVDAALSSAQAEALEVQSRSIEGVMLPDGVRVIDVLLGDGPEPSDGQRVYIHFKFWYTSFDDGMPIYSTAFDSRPIDLILGSPYGRIFAGLDSGIHGMREKGWRRLIVPPALGYGDVGLPLNKLSGRALPPGATLYVDIHMMDGGSGRCDQLLRIEGRKKSWSCERGKI